MQASGSAPAKIILFGEHAVVYGRPALAVPVPELRARATLRQNPQAANRGLGIRAPAVSIQDEVGNLPADHPLAVVIHRTLELLDREMPAGCDLQIESNIPVSGGMGSGAAVSVAVIRALAGFFDRPLTREQVNSLAFEIEKIHHGSPSGIDNTVVTYEEPVYFVKSQPIHRLRVAKPFTLVIADSGIPSPTAITVAAVRRAWQTEPVRYEQLFDEIGTLAQMARFAIETGRTEELGPLMDQSHVRLCEIDVSRPEIDRLVDAARQAGALGAKLSGGGRGGNVIALVAEQQAAGVAAGLKQAGAAGTLITTVAGPRSASQ